MPNLYKLFSQDLEKKLDLIDILRTITEGKIYVENERARITSILAKIHEKDGELEKAAKILQELQVLLFLILKDYWFYGCS